MQELVQEQVQAPELEQELVLVLVLAQVKVPELERELALVQEQGQAPELEQELEQELERALVKELASGQPQTLRENFSGSGRSGAHRSEEQLAPAGSRSPRC